VKHVAELIKDVKEEKEGNDTDEDDWRGTINFDKCLNLKISATLDFN
jgi:hypothetical protein